MVNKFAKKLWRQRVNELLTKELINEEQKDRLVEMINSPDLENFTLVLSIIKIMLKEKLSEDLNEGQKNAFEKITEFMDNELRADAIVLKGYAGTGKTFLVKKIIEFIVQTSQTDKVAIAAPTNKAVQVLYANSAVNHNNSEMYIFEDLFESEHRLLYTTVHKLLGLKEVINDQGQQNFVIDKINDCTLSDYSCLIVDEVSMLDDKICHDIMKFASKMPIIFMGDPAQIPPIHKTDSLPFKKGTAYNFETVELTEIMRQKGKHPIIDASFILRDNLTKTQPIPVIKTDLKDGKGIIHLDAKTDLDKVRPLLKKYFDSPEFKANPDYMKVIGWRNKSIAYINGIVREILYGENPPKFVVGEKLITNKPVFEKVRQKYGKNTYENWKILCHTSEEFSIAGIELTLKAFQEGPYTHTMQMYKLEIIGKSEGEEVFSTIYVVHEDAKEEYEKFLAGLKMQAVKSRTASFWVNYYNALKWSANLAYNYAITAHKSQGSTYNNVLILENDIDANNKVVERNRIKYTSYTRATDLLYVLKENTNE